MKPVTVYCRPSQEREYLFGISKIPAVSPLPCLQQGKPLTTGVPLLLKLSLLSLLTREKIHFLLPLTQPDSLDILCPPWVLKTKFCKHSHFRAIAFCLFSFMLSLHYHSKPFGKKTKNTQVYWLNFVYTRLRVAQGRVSTSPPGGEGWGGPTAPRFCPAPPSIPSPDPGLLAWGFTSIIFLQRSWKPKKDLSLPQLWGGCANRLRQGPGGGVKVPGGGVHRPGAQPTLIQGSGSTPLKLALPVNLLDHRACHW